MTIMAAGRTQSVCPVCLQRIEARRVAEGKNVYLEKECPEHGASRTILWRGEPEYDRWFVDKQPAQPAVCDTKAERGCPYDCGLCPDHRQQSCCVLLELTDRCNLGCPVCFARSGEPNAEPSLAVIEGWFHKLLAGGGPYNIQLSGGEPTLREDLPEIISLGRSLGFEYFQLNTNGLRLAAEPKYAETLKAAGLSSVFLQFDGTRDEIYRKIRGRPLLAVKTMAIEHCRRQGLGVVLVPTLVPDVNLADIGAIIRWGLSQAPTVRGVHFQPISYFGRYPRTPRDEDRITLPELMRAIEAQTGELMKVVDFRPPGGENAHCSFHGNYVVLSDGRLLALKSEPSGSCCKPDGGADGARKAQEFVARRWTLPEKKSGQEACDCPGVKVDSLTDFLARIEQHSFCVSAMAFQDAWNLDLERLRECLIHVVSPTGTLVPFCAYNLTAQSGKPLYRRTAGFQP